MKCDSKNLNAKEMIPARFLRHSLAAIPTAEIDRAVSIAFSGFLLVR
jgi:hypothetical protein